MLLKEILDALRYGELAQMSIGGQDAGVINQSNFVAIASHINMGMTALAQRFLLKEDRLEVPLVPGQYEYTITAPDFLKVQRIYADTGYEFHLNDLADRYSIVNSTPKVLKLPYAVVDQVESLPRDLKTQSLLVIYRAKPMPLELDSSVIFDEEDLEVDLPSAFLEPLCYYVASRLNNPVGMVNEFHAGNTYMAKYEAACRRLEMDNMAVDRASERERFERNGWV